MTAIDPDYASQITVPYLAGDEASIMVVPYNHPDVIQNAMLEVGVWRHTYFIVPRLGYWARDYRYPFRVIDMRTKTMADVQEAINEVEKRWRAHQKAERITAAFAA